LNNFSPSDAPTGRGRDEMNFPQNSIIEAINAKKPKSSMAWALPQKPSE
jgi:hypothetical protein